jgi:hypothetical protein
MRPLIKRTRVLSVIAALLAAGAVLHGSFPAAAAADDDSNAADEAAVTGRAEYEGQPAVRIEPDMQEKSAIRVARLKKETISHETRAIGHIVDIAPLLEQRTRYIKVQSDRKMTAASLEYSKRNVKRLETLHSMDSNISNRELQEARLKNSREDIRLEALDRELEAVKGQVLQDWGRVLTDWALGGKTGSLDALLQGNEVLILVQPQREVIPVAGGTVYMNAEDERDSARKAEFISAATRAAENRRGDTYYYRADAAGLRSGMNLYVWIPDPARQISGYILPRSAIVWHNGKPWYYVKKTADLFVKQSAADHVETAGGWLLNDTDLSREEVVVQGGQLLLSEENRRQIPDEDNDT